MAPSALSNEVLWGIVERKQDLVVADVKATVGVQLHALMPELFAATVRMKK